jgi:hypothetical protein
MDSFASPRALRRFTELGDPTLLLLGGFGVLFYLWCRPERQRLAQGWAVAFGLCIILTVSGKLAFYLEHDAAVGSRANSPSGHVAIAMTFYGGCAMLLSFRRRPSVRYLATAATFLFVCVLAASRLALGLHTLSEISVGLLIGSACLALFAGQLRFEAAPIDAGQLATLLLLLAITRFARVDAEQLIAHAGTGIRFLVGIRQL